MLTLFYCSSDDSSGGGNDSDPTPVLTLTGSVSSFGEVNVEAFSTSQSVQIKGADLTANVVVQASANYQVSLDDASFSSNVSISKNDVNQGNQTVYVRFAPSISAVGATNGTLLFKSTGASNKTLNLTGVGVSITSMMTVSEASLDFGGVQINQMSDSQSFTVNGDNLTGNITLSVTGDFEVSSDDVTYANSLQIAAADANMENTIYVRAAPLNEGQLLGSIMFESTDADNVTVNLIGEGLPVVYNYVTFNSERLAFGGGYNQSATQTFNLHDDLTNIEAVKMYVKLRCPTGGCDDWDVYANVKVRDADSGEFYEIGRYITPYWNDNSQLDRGFEFDVTDFKSLLTGSTELRIRTECWNTKGYEVTVDFDYIEGTPDYPHYAVSRVMAYDDWSSSGVPYGVAHSFDLDKSVTIPGNAESTHLRTIISGWGHATPNDAGGRGCAEWCYRTHNIKINGSNMFEHYLGPIGCASNPVSNQNPGNWQPDRAGWCPGMVVPVRKDEFSSSMAGNTFTYEYDYEDWVSDGGNGNAFYATSTFVVVKSNTPINKPTVAE